jgi:hypothetical protein
MVEAGATLRAGPVKFGFEPASSVVELRSPRL